MMHHISPHARLPITAKGMSPKWGPVRLRSPPKVQLRGALYVHPSHRHRIKCPQVLDGEREEWWGDYAAR